MREQLQSVLLVGFLIGSLAAGLSAGESKEHRAKEDRVFTAVDLTVEAGAHALAGYQIVLTYPMASVSIVGVEGGEKGYEKPPRFDAKGLKEGRLILAALASSDQAASTGATRVARLHLHAVPSALVQLKADLQAAVRPGGKKISATVKVTPRRASPRPQGGQ
ncbi:MAG: hypothetical protein ACYTGH_00165 [Planctomycetota bacterium]|jgi:hypothetical protein